MVQVNFWPKLIDEISVYQNILKHLEISNLPNYMFINVWPNGVNVCQCLSKFDQVLARYREGAGGAAARAGRGLVERAAERGVEGRYRPEHLAAPERNLFWPLNEDFAGIQISRYKQIEYLDQVKY